jgi:hypothetical protein
VGLAFVGSAQEAHVAALISKKHVFERMRLAFAAVVDLLLIVVERPRYGSLGSILIKRGGEVVCCASGVCR